MRRVVIAIGGMVLGSFLLVAAVAAANPAPSPSVTVSVPAASTAAAGDPQPSTSATVAAVDPTAVASAPIRVGGATIATVLGLTEAQIRELRQQGLSLAQIAARQGVPVQKLTDALVAQWRVPIDARVASGALTPTDAAALLAQLQTRAEAMVSSTTPGGMQGAAVGAGPQSGMGPQSGACDGTGPAGAGRP